ncbi:hypothetical protein [Coprothermobacter platensis]|uniref:hypothetical protein n=1 Tax=Coprothermobacter platensis TaxID=108819 RepID=UPI00039C54B0|nr:hypothetical protein [Coprothermobacter platensis]
MAKKSPVIDKNVSGESELLRSIFICMKWDKPNHASKIKNVCLNMKKTPTPATDKKYIAADM